MEGRCTDLGHGAAVVRLSRALAATLAQLLFPIECVGCGRESVHLCGACANRIRVPPLEPRCFGCGCGWLATHPCPACQRYSVVSRLFWLGPYPSRLLQNTISALKYDGRWGIGHALGRLLAERLLAAHILPCIIVPIPLGRCRQAQRGFNQAESLASSIAVMTGWTVRTDLIHRVRSTDPQAQQKTPDARETNVAGAFGLSAGLSSEPLPGRVLLVDDVWTTGSTMQEAAGVLANAGVSEIIGAVVAKG